MRERLCDLKTTLPGVAVLALVGFLCWLKPELIDKPETLLLLLAGFAGVFYKSKAN